MRAKLPVPPARIQEMRDWLWTGAEEHHDQRCKDALTLFDFLMAYSRVLEDVVHETRPEVLTPPVAQRQSAGL